MFFGCHFTFYSQARGMQSCMHGCADLAERCVAAAWLSQWQDKELSVVTSKGCRQLEKGDIHTAALILPFRVHGHDCLSEPLTLS